MLCMQRRGYSGVFSLWVFCGDRCRPECAHVGKEGSAHKSHSRSPANQWPSRQSRRMAQATRDRKARKLRNMGDEQAGRSMFHSATLLPVPISPAGRSQAEQRLLTCFSTCPCGQDHQPFSEGNFWRSSQGSLASSLLLKVTSEWRFGCWHARRIAVLNGKSGNTGRPCWQTHRSGQRKSSRCPGL